MLVRKPTVKNEKPEIVAAKRKTPPKPNAFVPLPRQIVEPQKQKPEKTPLPKPSGFVPPPKKPKPTFLPQKTLVLKQNNAKRIEKLPKPPLRHKPSGSASLPKLLNANAQLKQKGRDRKPRIVSNAKRGPGKV